jgi:drug/metabolite transporter (DMT)-like permease
MLLAGALFALMGLCVRLASGTFSQTELVLYRSLAGLLFLAPLLLRPSSLRTAHWQTHLWRGLAGGTALWLYFYAITHLPLATAVSLNYTSPLFLTLYGSRHLGERAGYRLRLALLAGFAGVLLLLQPVLTPDRLIPAAAGLASGALASLAYVNVRRLGQAGEPEWRVVFLFSLTCSAAFGLLAVFDGIDAPAPGDLPLLLTLGLSATLAQLAMTRAYGRGRTLVAGCLSYSTLLFSALAGALVLGEMPGPLAWLGMALIVLAGVASMALPAPTDIAAPAGEPATVGITPQPDANTSPTPGGIARP